MKALICLVLALAPSSRAGWSWHKSLSPHFAIHHEAAFLPDGYMMSLERLHGRLRLDLGMFSPWMGKERLKLYLYRNRRSYLTGEFKPPSWSNGISLYDKRTVVVHDQVDRAKLLEVTAHETTHILFESYWGEAGKTAPGWLNEGLAMVQEGDPEHPERSDWFGAMATLLETGYLGFDDFMSLDSADDFKNDKSRVQTWYVQAYSLSYFLLRKHSRFQFKNLCAALRDGKPVQEAFWLVYRYKNTAQLEKAWVEWLMRRETRRKIQNRPRRGNAS